MGKEFLDQEVFRVEFPDENWVDVKEELTQEDQDYIITEMAQTDGEGFKLGRLSLLERSITAWSFQNGDGRIIINRDNISRLRLKYRNQVLTEIDRLSNESMEWASKN